MSTVKVIIADDHKLIIDGLKALLGNAPGVRIIAEAENGLQLVEQARILEPHLVITDIDMPVMSGIDAVKQLRKEFPELKILVLTMHKDKSFYTKMKEAGANGYIHKNIDKEELLFAIHKVSSGKEYTSTEIHEEPEAPAIPAAVTADALTKREIEILIHIAEGLTNAEIGNKLFISDRTVDTHRTNIMRKLNVNNVAGLIRYAYTNNLVK